MTYAFIIVKKGQDLPEYANISILLSDSRLSFNVLRAALKRKAQNKEADVHTYLSS